MLEVSTKITLWFDLANSPSLSEEDKALITGRLGSRIDKEGVLRVVSDSTRSRLSNREMAVERIVELLRAALKRLPIRKKTRVSKGAKERRLEEKKQRSGIKRERMQKVSVEDWAKDLQVALPWGRISSLNAALLC